MKVDLKEPLKTPDSSETGASRISRRVFLGSGAAAAVGGALVIGFTLRRRFGHAGIAD